MIVDISILMTAVALLIFAISYLMRSVKIITQPVVIGKGTKVGMRYSAKVGKKK